MNVEAPTQQNEHFHASATRQWHGQTRSDGSSHLALTMWKTDVFGWQESTDPLYEDIPLIFALRDGVPTEFSWTTPTAAALI